MSETNYVNVGVDFVLSGNPNVLSTTVDALLAKKAQTVSTTVDAKLNRQKSVTVDALIVDPNGSFRGTMTTSDRDALPALQAKDTVLNIDATTEPHGTNVNQMQYWTGSAWLSAHRMQSPGSGVTNLFVAPTTAGWRVELGDPTYPVRFWDGTDTNFSFDNAGVVLARSMNIRPKSSDQYGYNVTRSSVNGDALSMQVVGDTEYRYFQEVSGNMYWGDGSSTQDVSFFRAAAGMLRVGDAISSGTGGVLGWGATGNSRLDYDSSVQFTEISAPSTPPANRLKIYAKDKSGTTTLYYKDDGGSEYDLSTSTATPQPTGTAAAGTVTNPHSPDNHVHALESHGAAKHNDLTRSIFLRAGDLSAYSGTVATNGTTPNIATVIQLATGATQGFGYTFRVPDDYTTGAVNYFLYWEGSTTESGKIVDFRRTYLDITDTAGNLIDASGTTNTHATSSINITAKQPNITVSAGNVSAADSAAGHIYRVVHRRFTGGTDTYGGTVEIIGVLIQYTANQ